MRLTDRDIRLIRDLALSHVMSRDQIIRLYFGSVTRCNFRMRELVAAKFVTALRTPFHTQMLYASGPLAVEIVGENIAPLLVNRAESPRFVRHALTLGELRLYLLAKGAKAWRFEQQLWRQVDGHTLKPDGLAITSTLPAFIECDLGHVAPSKFKEKLNIYRALAHGGRCAACYGFDHFRLIIATTGPRRAARLRSLIPADAGYECMVQCFSELGIAVVGGWS